jgi:hypothetical protein
VRVSVPDGRVSRAAAEARSGSAGGGAAAAPTSEFQGLNEALRNLSEAQVSRSRRVWASGCVSPTGAKEGQPTFLISFRREGSEVPCPAVFTTRGARSRTQQYVEHPEARKLRWVRCIAGRSRKLVRNAGSGRPAIPTERREENAARGPESARSQLRRGVGRSPRGSPPARRRRAALEADGSNESLLSKETSAENAWPRAKTADGGRARRRRRVGIQCSTGG